MLKAKGLISPLQKEILAVFSTLPDAQNFYLTGGTALAEFYLGHRKSFDLDLFTSQPGIILPFSRILEAELKKNFSLKIVRRFESFAEFEAGKADQSVKIQLAYDSPFKFESPLESELGVKVNHYTDLISDKLLAFFGRAEPRDAIDLFFILQKTDFWELVELAARKDPGFDLYWLAIALEKIQEFPDEINRWPVEMLISINIAQLKDQFLNLAKTIMNKIKPTESEN